VERLEEVVVTGSRIRRAEFEANSPFVTVDTAAFEDTSAVGVESVLNQLPQFMPAGNEFATTGNQNNALSTTGISTVSLRGLGPNRNLVLIDGRRATPVNAQMVVDTNSIPASAIERVEVISGGASAVYGADAVGGVVNFILRNDFDGFELSSQYGITEEGDGAEFRVAPFFGASFDDGRGNVMLGLTYEKRDEVWDRDRQWIRDDWADPSIGGGANWQTDTVIHPQNFDWNGNGIVQNTEFNRPTQAAIDSLFNQVPGLVGREATFSLAPNGMIYTGAQSLIATDPEGAYRWPGMQEGGLEYRDGDVFRKRTDDGLIRQNNIHQMLRIPLERRSMFARGRYEISDNISAIGQATYTKSANTTIFEYAPATNSSAATVPHGTGIYAPSRNPDGTTNVAYLSGGRFGLNCAALGGCTNSQAFPLPPELDALMNARRGPQGQNGANLPVTFGRALDFVPARTNENDIESYQLVFGLEGDLPGIDWSWDAHLSYGETTTTIVNRDFVPLENYRAVVQSPNFGHGAFLVGNQVGGGTAAGEAQCTSGLPVFGNFEASKDCIEAITADLIHTSKMEQTVFEANIQGGVLDLPAGEVRSALGFQHRENSYDYITDFTGDQFNFTNQIVGLFPLGSSQGSIEVNEVYGEALVPILSDLPGIEDFSLELGVRFSDYDTIGEVTTYKALAAWSVTDFVRFRGGIQKANRAPNIAELFLARTQESGFEQWGDQCSANNISPVSPNLEVASPEQVAQSRAICEALMGAGAGAYYGQPIPLQQRSRGRQVSRTNAVGNPDVQDEQADTLTVGLVFTSPWDNSWLRGFVAALDWYDIEISDMIALGSQDATYIQCMSLESNPSGDLNDPACQMINRDPDDGTLLPTNVTFTNEGRARTQGYDVQLNWNSPFIEPIRGRVAVNVVANFLEKYETQVADDVAPVDWVGTNGSALDLQSGAYEWRTLTTINYILDDLRVGLRWRHLPEVNAASEATTPNARVLPIKSYDVFDLTANWTINDTLRLRAGVQNLFDAIPPRGSIDLDAALPNADREGGAFYDQLGRRYYFGFTSTF
jgi:outer membrane receptor protein involved in Fe transport